jgi:heme a synthase
MYIDNKQINNYISYWLLSIYLIVSLIIVVGGLTRLTDSGLSITEWELFKGILPPLNTSQWNKYFELYKKIPEYKLHNNSMVLSEFKVIFWWEFIHRLLARIIGILFLIPLIFFTIKIGFKKTANFHIIFLLICLQGFIGWYMVSSGLIDRVDVSHYRLATHLVLAFIILSLTLWSFLNTKKIALPLKKINNFFPFVFIILLFSQIIIGAFVSGMDAGKIYNSWPLMGAGYFPDDNNILNLFSFSVFNDASLVQFIHRNLAYLIFLFYIIFSIKIYTNKMIQYYKTVFLIGVFLFLQIVLGVLTLLSGAQIFLSSVHQISSIFLTSSSIYFLYINTKKIN